MGKYEVNIKGFRVLKSVKAWMDWRIKQKKPLTKKERDLVEKLNEWIND